MIDGLRLGAIVDSLSCKFDVPGDSKPGDSKPGDKVLDDGDQILLGAGVDGMTGGNTEEAGAWTWGETADGITV